MRQTLLTFLSTLPPDLLRERRPGFGQGSILETLTHVADCYGGWTSEVLMEEPWAFAEGVEPTLDALRTRFERVDALLARALQSTRLEAGEWTHTTRQGDALLVSGPWLLLHPLTHEFHHKGQVVALARVLGHPVPPDVDLDLPPPGGWGG
ncbi:DinB family protein [Deinococcus sonorensis]